jgi:hypothetical protein
MDLAVIADFVVFGQLKHRVLEALGNAGERIERAAQAIGLQVARKVHGVGVFVLGNPSPATGPTGHPLARPP